MKPARREKGAVLLMLLVAVTVIGLMAGIAGSSWKTIAQRAREKELLWRGNQYIKAVESYYKGGKSRTPGMFPQSLEQLVQDPRSIEPVRHIRRLYLDPMTGDEFEVVKDNTGRIRGVYSRSKLEPFKKDNFWGQNKDFANKTSYSEWRFVYTPAPKGQQPLAGQNKTGNAGLNPEQGNPGDLQSNMPNQ